MLASFDVYRTRPCLGTCPGRTEAEGLDCNWHSYEEVGMSSRALAEGLREVVDGMGPSVILGLLSAVSDLG
ncbi:unnamed protein product [Durusdinium trenchii]|uniref:Uncharacterized protein n=1 Tax=Durusdinium trenchii TaxID=1381693 RepID=A0ABP0KYF9_9DINO